MRLNNSQIMKYELITKFIRFIVYIIINYLTKERSPNLAQNEWN